MTIYQLFKRHEALTSQSGSNDSNDARGEMSRERSTPPVQGNDPKLVQHQSFIHKFEISVRQSGHGHAIGKAGNCPLDSKHDE